MKSLKQIIDMNAQYLEGFEPEEHKDDTRDCIGEFRDLWKYASPTEKKMIRQMIDAEEETINVPHKKIVELYHEILPTLRKVKLYGSTRSSIVRARWLDMPSLKEWEEYFRLVSRCPHLIGKGQEWNGRVWRADFDWLIKQSNFTKVVEGKYGE